MSHLFITSKKLRLGREAILESFFDFSSMAANPDPFLLPFLVFFSTPTEGGSTTPRPAFTTSLVLCRACFTRNVFVYLLQVKHVVFSTLCPRDADLPALLRPEMGSPAGSIRVVEVRAGTDIVPHAGQASTTADPAPDSDGLASPCAYSDMRWADKAGWVRA